MPKFKFAKLVRDKIVENQIASGAKPKYHHLDDKRHKQALILKIIEETKEITQAKPEEVAGEIADVQQALDDLKQKYGLTDMDIAKAQKIKLDKNGAFKEGLYVDYVEVDKDNKWVEYYRKNSDRYPEIK
jgi:predicted house-cleaning noncanonical NTP pyrophosphatase (MazG superfamily)